MITERLFGKTRRKVLDFLIAHDGEEFHLREIARRTGCGVGGLQRELRNLTDGGVVVRRRVGNLARYTFDPTCPVARELRGLFAKTSGMFDILRRALAPFSEHVSMACVFGSVAAGTARSDSDVDVLVVGSVAFRDVVDGLLSVQDVLGREINPVVMDHDEVRRRLAEDDPFLRDILQGEHVLLMGTTNDLARLGR